MSDLNVSMILRLVDRVSAPIRGVIEKTQHLAAVTKQASQAASVMESHTQSQHQALERLGRSRADIEHFRGLKQALISTRTQMQGAQTRLTELGRALAAARSDTSLTSAEIKTLETKFSAAKREASALKSAHQSQTIALQNLRGRLQSAGIDTRNLAQSSRELNTQITAQTQAMERQAQALERVGQIKQRMRGLDDAIAANSARQASLIGDGFATAGVAYGMGRLLQPAIEFEQAMADVTKVVDFNASDSEGSLSKGIRELATSGSLAQNEIAQIVAAAGQADMVDAALPDQQKIEELLAFTQDAARMKVAFDMSSAEEAGQAMAGLRAVLRMNQDEVLSHADAINYLSNKTGSYARDIVNIQNRAGAVARQFGLTADQSAALAASFLEMRTPPEVAATAMSAMLQRLAAAEKQTPKFQAALAELGYTAQGIGQMIDTDAQGALFDLFEAISKAEGQEGILVDLFGMEHSDQAMKLIGALDRYRRNVSLIEQPDAFAGSMLAEYERYASTTAHQLAVFNNNLRDLGIVIGTAVLPALNDLLETLIPIIQDMTAWAEANPELVSTLFTIASALIAIRLASIGLRFMFGSIFGILLKLRKFTWAAVLVRLSWAAFVPRLRWLRFLNPLNWVRFIGRLSWARFLPSLNWGAVAGRLSWRSLIPVLRWGVRFIPYIGWAVLAGELLWHLLIKPLGWFDFIADIDWGGWFDFKWADLLPDWNWGEIIPSLRNFFAGESNGQAASAYQRGSERIISEQPLIVTEIQEMQQQARQHIPVTLDAYGMPQAAANFADAVGLADTTSLLPVQTRAKGGPIMAGKHYLVGEQGPEIVRFGHSGRVFPNLDTQKMLSASQSLDKRPALSGAVQNQSNTPQIGNVSIQIHAAPGMDEERLARRVMAELERRLNPAKDGDLHDGWSAAW